VVSIAAARRASRAGWILHRWCHECQSLGDGRVRSGDCSGAGSALWWACHDGRSVVRAGSRVSVRVRPTSTHRWAGDLLPGPRAVGSTPGPGAGRPSAACTGYRPGPARNRDVPPLQHQAARDRARSEIHIYGAPKICGHWWTGATVSTAIRPFVRRADLSRRSRVMTVLEQAAAQGSGARLIPGGRSASGYRRLRWGCPSCATGPGSGRRSGQDRSRYIEQIHHVPP
jgi:hypothetical protein